ncbi:MAG: response regulator [Rhodospirillaceae bacterium]|nr:response regulator [Rhodospirillaceae bacterium]
MSIRTRLLILVLLATLVPGLLIGLRFLQDRGAGIRQAQADLRTLAEALTHELDEKIKGTNQLLYGLARARDLETQDRAACSRFLSDVREQNPQYTGILTIRTDGALFCDSLQSGRDLDLSDRGYFKSALALKGGVALETTFGRLTGLAVLQIAHPARAETAEPRFVLLASLNLQKLVEAYQVPLGRREILLVNKKGTILVWQPGTEHAVPLGASMAETDLFGAVVKGLAEAGNGVAVIEEDGKVWAVADAARSQDAGLYVLVGLPERELVAVANKRLLVDLASLVALSLLLFAGVWTFAEFSIRRRVELISAMIARLGQGDLDARIPPPHPTGDLGKLMVLLNGTAESLKRQRDAIEELDQKLRQSQKMEAIGQLTGGIAHDFNNLLTVVLGNAEMLAERLDADRQLKGLAEMTVKAALRGAELTSRLLAFARRQPLDPKATDVNQLIEGMDGLLRRTLGEQIDITRVPQADLWPALVDQGQLENALLNLCINARDAMKEGGRLTLETSNVTFAPDNKVGGEGAVGEYVMIAVSDSGTGMDSATLERAFEPFFTTKELGRGSGLGLSMVYGFVKQSLGHVLLYSEPGHGTSVKLYLPRAIGAASQTGRDLPASVRGGSENILLVEDDALVRDHVARQLGDLGYQVVAVASGAEALATLSSGTACDLLFTDIVMPGGMDGQQLAASVAQQWPALPILFTSGYTEQAVKLQGRLAQGSHFLAKPFRHQELAAKLRSILDRSH